MDYSKTIFSQGLVCLNTNNNAYCIVINGNRGHEDDRSSLVIEFTGKDGFMLHTPPNRARVPTGRIKDLAPLTLTLSNNVSTEVTT